MLRAVFFCAFCAPAFGQNAVVDNLVRDGVFGVAWGDRLESVKSRYPDGKIERVGEYDTWEIRDGRAIFEIERRSLDTLSFSYLAERLVSISASFRGSCVDVPTALRKFLGASDEETAAESIGNAVAPRSATLGTWRGADFEITLAFGATGSCFVGFGPRAFEPAEATRRQLGLE